MPIHVCPGNTADVHVYDFTAPATPSETTAVTTPTAGVCTCLSHMSIAHVYAYVYAYVFVPICEQVFAPVCEQVYAYVHAHVYTYMSILMSTHMSMHMSVHMLLRMSVHMSMRMLFKDDGSQVYTHIYACVYPRVYKPLCTNGCTHAWLRHIYLWPT